MRKLRLNLNSLARVGDAEPLRARTCQHRSAQSCAVSVGIGLDDGKYLDRWPCTTDERLEVSSQPRFGDLNPVLHIFYGKCKMQVLRLRGYAASLRMTRLLICRGRHQPLAAFFNRSDLAEVVFKALAFFG